MTASQSSSFIRSNRLSRVTPALATRMSTGARRRLRLADQAVDRARIGEVARTHAGPRAKLGAERVQRILRACPESDDRGALRMQARAIAPPMPPRRR